MMVRPKRKTRPTPIARTPNTIRAQAQIRTMAPRFYVSWTQLGSIMNRNHVGRLVCFQLGTAAVSFYSLIADTT
jgi:hypothetical protein